MSNDEVIALLDRLRVERREELRSFILSVIAESLPNPQELRVVAGLVNIDRVRKVDSAETLIGDFKRVEETLLGLAKFVETWSKSRE